MQNRSTLLIVLSVIGAIAIAFTLYAFSSNRPPIPDPIPLIGKSNQELIESCLTVQIMDKSFQWDSKVAVAYTNICPNYAFKLTKTGIKYESGKKIKYKNCNTPLLVNAMATETLELSIPFGITPRVAYALSDDAKAIVVE